MVDQRPHEEAEYIEFTTTAIPVAAAAPAAAASTTTTARQPHISLDENAPEANPPEPFEVRTSYVTTWIPY